MHENWLAERGEQFRSGIQIATVDPFQGQKEHHRRSTPRRNQRPRCLPYRQAHWRRSRRGAPPASSKTRPVTAGARVIPSTQVRNLLRASRDRLTKRQQERLREAFTADEARISVDVAYLHRASARGLPPSHTRPRPTPGRSSHPAPTSLSRPRNRSPGPDPTQVEGRTRRLLRYRRSKQRLLGSHQRTLSSWADAPPEATATPPATNSECSSSQEV